MSLKARLLERPGVYRAIQAPFRSAKLAPLFAHNDLSRVRKVLDVGCGPGTNAEHFSHTDYTGIDINPGYVRSARSRYSGRFQVADVTDLAFDEGSFDFILANSLFHHLPDSETERSFSGLRGLLAEGGHVHVLDLVLPAEASPARLLARWDRGDHARSLDHWEALLTRSFEPVVFEPYSVGVGGVDLWKMLYFKGRARRV